LTHEDTEKVAGPNAEGRGDAGCNPGVIGEILIIGQLLAVTRRSCLVFMTMQQFILIAASCVYLVALVATAYFTRATARRVVGALMGGVAVGVVGVGVEILAHTLGWWRYPSVETTYGPPFMYLTVVLMFAVLALIGWRVTRRFGWRGQGIFLVALAILGTLRDYQWAARLPEIIVFAPGIGIVLADAACWVSLSGLAQAVMSWVAGPVNGDALARRPGRAT
jgi:hypothetical protein